ncbi:hypothetical protein ACHQM5_001921 [Ranunculus cassubicifolius]
MDLPLSPESPQITERHAFRSLKLANVSLSDILDSNPAGSDSGTLDNGLRYYVRSNPKPKMRAALALAIKIGSIVEEEEERGVAHIVEHLAFSATKKYTNHDIVKFLEGIGAEFGACQNASTSADETIYELLVPVDKPELLSQAISILAEFSSEVRVSAEDLEKERGAVLEEYRGNRNAHGRWHDAHWLLMMEGSKYAERLPIGLEKVIKTVSPEMVKQFYQKWYHLNNMAVVAVGDFSDTQSVVELIKMHFGQKINAHSPPLVPYYPVPSHTEPRFSCFVESEACGTAVMISCKMQANEMKTVKDYKDSLAESMFHRALNQRYFKLSRRKDPPYFSCSSSAEDFVRPVKAYMMSASCKENGTIEALESMLMEIARVRLHGFTEREISIVRTLLMSDIESTYLERDQLQSTDLRDEYVQHFLYNEPVLEIEFEAQLQKTLLPQISAEEVSKYAENFRTTCSCVVKTMEPQSHATVDDLKAVLLRVNLLEEEGNIFPWDEDHIPEKIITTLPDPGSVIQQLEYPTIGITELLLSNGMRVCYKCTDFLDDQVLFNGFSYGGLSEISEEEYFSCLMSSTIAREIGVFGYKPPVLMDMLAGKRVDFNTKVGSYMRTFCGDCSPADLETALQLVYKLFTTNIVPGEEEVKLVMDRTEESIRAQERDPYTAYANRVRELNYGSSYFFKPMTMSDLEKVDPRKACEFFNSCFKDPSTFTVLIVGNLNPPLALPLILQYLAGIPKPPEPVLHFNRDELKGLPFAFPATIIREVVRSPMVEAQCSVQLSFPVNLKNESMIEEIHFVGFLTKLLETKIMQILRFKHGHIYSVAVKVFLGGNKPSRTGDVRGDISVNFSCDPNTPWKLVKIVLDEILRLQTVGPSEEDISSVLQIEQRGHENGLQENYYWLDRIMRSYQSRVYCGDVEESYDIQEKARKDVRESLTASVAQCALQRVLPCPCTKQYTVVVLMPQTSRMKMVKSYCDATFERYSKQVKVLGVVSGAMLLAASLWRFSRHSKSGV